MKKLQHQILAWFQLHARELPWRKTYDPYHVWISEIMLQQTQMDRAVDYFNRWMSRFPDIASIAGASEEEVLKLWEGLGYYSRARNIVRSANILLSEYKGRLPADHDLLLKLPGIGKYTAGAIMSIAFNKEYPLVDANIERVFSRLFNLAEPVKDKKTHAFIWLKAKELLPGGKAREFNQALMELGALVCIARNPRCKICPIRTHCQAYGLDLVAERPVLQDPPKTIFIEMVTGILKHEGRVLIQKRKAHGVWANLWEFPGGRLEPGETPEMALVREYLEETELKIGNLKKITTVQHSYTVYRVTLHCYFCSLLDGRFEPVLHGAQEYRWLKAGELSGYAFPAGHRKLINHLQKQ
ncbi:MAG: A/G-specific adenine glycosylase [Desulfobacterales bacterium SG8_35]|nr:MAG: A/G-specific adenine glycosylase [Desulfobacterales bacterium SG8_35]